MLTQTFLNILSNLGPVFCVVFCSIMPVLETKIGIPLGMDHSVFHNNALCPIESFLIAFISSSVMAICLTILFHCLFKKTKNKKLNAKFAKIFSGPMQKMQNLTKAKKMFLCTMFVVLPIPFSGIYGASILCALIKQKLADSILSIFIGNAVSCLIEFFACWVLKSFISLLISIIMICIILVMVYNVLAFVLQKTIKTSSKNA